MFDRRMFDRRLVCAVIAILATAIQASGRAASPLILRYRQPAENSAVGWERESLPLGNGFLGASLFGGVTGERIQITEGTLWNPLALGGLNNAAELSLRFNHGDKVDRYERSLSLDDAVASCRYEADGVTYTREAFASHPDRVLAIRLTASRPGGLSFAVCPEIPFVNQPAGTPGAGGGKIGRVVAADDTIRLSGRLLASNVRFEGRIRVLVESGRLATAGNTIEVAAADAAVILVSFATNYRLEPRVFLERDPAKKLADIDPGPSADEHLAAAAAAGYDALKARHLADHRRLFGRVELELGDAAEDVPTDERLRRYAAGEADPGLEALYFQYGRYLLIASSRPGGLPAGLQGIWNCHDKPPWGADYHFDINMQLNYCPAFSTNLAESFQPLADYLAAIRPAAEALATDYIRHHNPALADDRPGSCGWTLGTVCSPLEIEAPSVQAGPGTGGYTTKLLWDWYDFTRDETALRRDIYPALAGMSRFLTRTVRDYDGRFLASWSASPEQMTGGRWPRVFPYHTVGCGFDQQMIHENGRDMLAAAAILGIDDDDVRMQRRQFGHYQPVEVGWSGQVKEYAEERFYGEIGEYRHRHISHLAALHPGASLNRDTPAWLDAAKVTLNERGDDAGAGGWALAVRLNCWARTGGGDRAHRLLRILIGSRTFPNLWDALRGPWDVQTFARSTPYLFQIDGNLGGTAGITEMLLQSHEDCVRVLPALPAAWPTGRFRGLVARGNFVIDAAWADGAAERVLVHARRGGRLRLACRGLTGARVTDGEGRTVACLVEGEDRIAFDTEADGHYTIADFRPRETPPAPSSFTASRPDLRLAWDGAAGCRYNVYRAVNGASRYEPLATRLTDCEYQDRTLDFAGCEIVTYKVTACRTDGSGETDGPTVTLTHATTLDVERHRHRVRQQNIGGVLPPDP
jgi:hypothetical protein